MIGLVVVAQLALVATADAATWSLKNSNTFGAIEGQFEYGAAGQVPLRGDWNADGCDTAGRRYNRNDHALRTHNGPSSPETYESLGGLIYNKHHAVAGRFQPSGPVLKDTIGKVGDQGGTSTLYWHLKEGDPNTAATAVQFYWGVSGQIPLTGDWRNVNVDDPVVFKDGQWSAASIYTTANISFSFGLPGDIPLMGDWNADGKDTPGVFRPSNAMWYLSNSFGGNGDYVFEYGLGTHTPIVGDWNCDNVDSVAVISGM